MKLFLGLGWVTQNRGYLRQVLVCCSVSFLPFMLGMMLTWPSLGIERILDGAAGFQMTHDEISVLVSVGDFSACLTPFVFGFILVRLGRKTNLLLNAVVYIISCSLITFASSPMWLITGVFTAGLGGAICLIIGPIYIAEIADKRIRGALISIYVMAMSLGAVFMSNVGMFLSYVELNLISLGLSFVALLTITIFAVESPYWHLMVNEDEKAENCFRYYWKSNTNMKENEVEVSEALAALKQTVQAEMESACSYRELSRTPSNIQASIIAIALSLFQGTSGSIAVVTYGSSTLPKYDGFWQPHPTMALYHIIGFLSKSISVGFSDVFGRKPLVIMANVGDALGTGIVAIFFFIDECTSVDTSGMKWLPYIGFIVLSFSNASMSVVPHILVGELFPTNVRYHASVVALSCVAGSVAFVNFIYWGVCNYAGFYVMYLTFTLSSVAAGVFSWYYVFETKNMSLAEIQLKAMDRQHCRTKWIFTSGSEKSPPID